MSNKANEGDEWRQGPQVSFSLDSARLLFAVMADLDAEGDVGKCERFMDENDEFCEFCTAMNFLQLSIIDAEQSLEEHT